MFVRWRGGWRGVLERLESRRLLAVIQGVVREDLTGLGHVDHVAPGIAGVAVYLDLDNSGSFDPGEPVTLSAVDHLETPEDETGHYAFDVAPGIYVVRQDLPRGDAELSMQLLQTAPLWSDQWVNPFASLPAQTANRYQPNLMTYEFSGTIEDFDPTALPDEYAHLQPGDRWHVEITYRFVPSQTPEINLERQTFEHAVIESYALRFHGAVDDMGIGEFAGVDPLVTRLAMSLEIPAVTATVPLQLGDNLTLEVQAQLRPGVDPFFVPKVGDIEAGQNFLIYQSEGEFGRSILQGTVDELAWGMERPERFGHLVVLPDNEHQFFDFWNAVDDDGDSLPNVWESPGGGLDVNGDGVIDLDLHARGADPYHKDLFVEVDAMEGRGPWPLDATVALDVAPTRTILDHVIQAFSKAPIENPDGQTGIRLHIELDEVDLPIEPFLFDDVPWFEFDRIKNDHVGGADRNLDDANQRHVLAARDLVYRYGLFADTRSNGSSGLAELPGNDFFIALGDWLADDGVGNLVPGGSPEQQAGTFMHELGHTLGLRHGGDDHLNYKPNYLSVMNYHWQVPNSNVGWVLDYSRTELPGLNSNHLVEHHGIGGDLTDGHREVYVGPQPLQRVPVVGAVDWNRDGDDQDLDVQSDIYLGFVPDGDGVTRTYEMRHGDQPWFDPTLHGHDDWQLTPEDMMFRDDLEFSEGVHACDNPEQQKAVCAEDVTDFFTISVSVDPFEPDDHDEPVEIPVFDFSDIFVFDLATGVTWGTFSIHSPQDQDRFRWTPTAQGKFQASLLFADSLVLTPDLVILDEEGDPVGMQTRRPGRVDLLVDYETLQNSDDLLLVVKPESGDLHPDEPPDSLIDPTRSFNYRLEIYAPRLVDLDGTKWHGTDPFSGSPGNGRDWSDAKNWAVGDVADISPDPQSHHTFLRNDQIEMHGGRVVNSLQFRDETVVCDAACNDKLTVTSGIVDVFPNVVATIHADLKTVSSSITKRNQGRLELHGSAPTLRIVDGSLGGGVDVDGDLFVGARAVLDPGSVTQLETITATGRVTIDGTLRVQVDGSSNDRIAADTMRLTSSSVMIVAATERIGAADDVVQRTVASASRVTVASTDRMMFQQVRAAEHELFRHAGQGVFLRDVFYELDRVDVELFQARPGDSNGDGRFTSDDIVQVFIAGKYLTGQAATWTSGDWNGDGKFTVDDFVEAFIAGFYEVTPAARHAESWLAMVAASRNELQNWRPSFE